MYKNIIFISFLTCFLLTSCNNSSDKLPVCTAGYKVVTGWPNLPDGLVLGDVSGVGVNSHGHIFIFHRGPNNDANAADTILEINADSGALISSWGRGLFTYPHGLSVDKDDNVWVTDLMQHQAYKFSSDGELLLTLGVKNVSGSDASHFDGPTDVAVDSNGNIYVSDGQGNSRVTKFDKEGLFLYSWGASGSGLGEFDTPHGLTIFSNIIYVADRGNARVQLFNTNSDYISTWESEELGRPWGLASTESYVYVVDGGDPGETERSQALKLDNGGIIVSKWGQHGDNPGEFDVAHDIDVDSSDSVYIAEINGQRIQKFETCF